MLNKNYAGTTASIIRSTFPNITAPKQTDLVSMLDQVGKDYQTGLQVRADNKLTDEMIAQNPEDEARIRQMGGRAYADMLKSDAQRAEERQWHLDDLESQRQFQRDLLRDKLNNEFALAKYKAQFDTAPQGTNAQQNVQAMIEAGYTPQEAWAMYYGGNNPTLDMASLGKKGFEAYDKKVGDFVADEEIAKKQMQTLKPKVDSALKRARESLEDGTGLGQIGGWGWTTGKGGQNRANIKNAQAQINTTMRGLLKQMGVGSTELNSAAEAESYRYMIDPNMPIAQQLQVLDNFEQDYLNGDLQKDLAETYAKPNMKQVNQLVTDPRVQEALDNGYSMEEIQKYLGK